MDQRRWTLGHDYMTGGVKAIEGPWLAAGVEVEVVPAPSQGARFRVVLNPDGTVAKTGTVSAEPSEIEQAYYRGVTDAMSVITSITTST